ncbi:MAG: hypothetical protein HY717_19530 [Planctomycetes bacterium]|nr:hypothetical protein [Planctomycetota bacterium]
MPPLTSPAPAAGRTKPREDGLGLPSLTVKLKFELPPEEHELVSKAIEKAARLEVRSGIDGLGSNGASRRHYRGRGGRKSPSPLTDPDLQISSIRLFGP